MSLGLTIQPELEELIQNISRRMMYSGRPMPKSVMEQFEIIETDSSAGILVPYWLPVFERGRGPRKSNQDHGLVYIIYDWMQRHNLFRSVTAKGKFNEAKSLTWYINKYGNKHFRSRAFIDIYTTERQKTIQKIDQKYGTFIGQITKEIL